MDILSRNLPRATDSHVLSWLYRENYHGKAHVWVVTDSCTGLPIGAAGAFPRRCILGDQEITGWVFGDFCLDSKYRSLGPALQLQRACLGVTEEKGGMFCYDFPSDRMVAVYKRLGISVTGKMVRVAKLLRVDRKVRQIINVPLARHVVTGVGNAILKLTAPAKVVPAESLEIALHQEPCGEEFSTLAREQGSRLGVCIKRSADYLNWRYVNNPLARYEFLTARRQGRLKGYAIWTQAGEDATVVDLFGENDAAIVKGLLSEIIDHVTTRGVMTLSVWLNESHPWLSLCSEMGFRVRGSAPFFCVPAPSLAKTDELRRAKWLLMQGDRDS
jgi:hypothetical protein